jgi:murein DD-endopeptidase MepM/ murein hydrolase activator NlpD
MLKTLSVALALVLTGCASGPFILTHHGDVPNEHYARAGASHIGIDIADSTGVPVRAAHDGKVVWLEDRSDGQWIHPELGIQHQDNVYIRYYHIERIQVQLGDAVKQGQTLAYLSRTGVAGPNIAGVYPGPTHLHIETRDRSRRVIDIMALDWSCPGQGGSWWWPVGCR